MCFVIEKQENDLLGEKYSANGRLANQLSMRENVHLEPIWLLLFLPQTSIY